MSEDTKSQNPKVNDTEEKLSRRKFIAAGAAAAGVLAASAVPGVAQAADGTFDNLNCKKITVNGNLIFSSASSGIISKGKRYKYVNAAQTANSQILVTLQSNPGTGIYLSHVKRVDDTKFRVILNKIADNDTPFAYLIIN